MKRIIYLIIVILINFYTIEKVHAEETGNIFSKIKRLFVGSDEDHIADLNKEMAKLHKELKRIDREIEQEQAAQQQSLKDLKKEFKQDPKKLKQQLELAEKSHFDRLQEFANDYNQASERLSNLQRKRNEILGIKPKPAGVEAPMPAQAVGGGAVEGRAEEATEDLRNN
jgi:DNA repair exonuclease SbcCD ATPase subunit